MFIARREAKCRMASLRCAGQTNSPVQRATASPSTRTTSDPHTGQCFGKRKLRVPGGRRSLTTPTTSGITSPARRMITVSPTRTSLRCTSSSLCSVALETVTPPTNTGCRRAVGVIAPVRPTCTSMAVTTVMASSAGNLCASAQRGARWRHAQAPLLHLFQDGAVALGQVAALHHTDPKTIHVEWSARRDARIELTQAACRGVARIRKYLFAALLLAPIQFGEAAFGHIHLAAHLEAPRRMCAHEAQWHRMYGAHVLRHVLAGVAVAARRRPHQHTVLVQ